MIKAKNDTKFKSYVEQNIVQQPGVQLNTVPTSNIAKMMYWTIQF